MSLTAHVPIVWNEAFQTERFAAWYEPTQFQIIVVADHDVGLLSIDQRPTELFVASLEILPAFQHRGIGTAVLGSILAQAAGDGLPVALQVLKVNPARRLYQRLGFQVVGETATHFVMRTA